jgi:hypothetical protein
MGIGSARKVFMVESLVESSAIPLHVRLVVDGKRNGDRLLIAASALLDTRLWQRVPAKAD